MKTKTRQIVVRFDQPSYDEICAQAKAEHRGLGEFVRHATLYYLETISKANNADNKGGGT